MKLPSFMVALWAVLPTSCGVDAVGVFRDVSSIKASYDYIIAGGGLTGLVVANRLTENANISILVVEPGDFDDSWSTAAPFLAVKSPQAQLMARIESIPQPELANRTAVLPWGQAVGGSTVVNGMTVLKGSVADYDIWRDLGNPGWGWDDILPYFEKSTTLNPPPNHTANAEFNITYSQASYGHGPLQISWPPWAWPDTNVVNAAFKDIGLGFRSDGGTNGQNLGLIYIPLNATPKNFTRCSARTAYYDPINKRPNLDLLLTHSVSKVLFKNLDAIGVEVMAQNSSTKSNILATKEVLLATGGATTPKILQLSGIGPAAILKPLGIPVILDNPGVGANFQDHPRVSTAFDFKKQSPLNGSLVNDTKSASYLAYWNEYLANRTGPFTIVHGEKLAQLSLPALASLVGAQHTAAAENLTRPDHDPTPFAPDFYKPYPALLAGYREMTLATQRAAAAGTVSLLELSWGSGGPYMGNCITKPLSRGTLHVASADPRAPPRFDFGTFRHPLDVQIGLLGVRAVRRLLGAPSLAALQPVELAPLAGVEGDAALERLLREQLLNPTDANPHGTAAMLPREWGGVVDSQLRVYGVNRLRVVDASVIPVGPVAHLQITLYGVAEKAADLIKGVAKP